MEGTWVTCSRPGLPLLDRDREGLQPCRKAVRQAEDAGLFTGPHPHPAAQLSVPLLQPETCRAWTSPTLDLTPRLS